MKTIIGGMGRGWRWLALANLFMVGLSSFFAVSLALELLRARPLPPPPAPGRDRATAGRLAPPSAEDAERLETYNVIVARNLFTASRTEAVVATARAVVPPAAKPLLHGVILDGPWSLAYLEEPGVRRVVGYRVGDSIAGGRLVKIADDAVFIRRPDGQVEVLLKDPGKPARPPERPAAPPDETSPGPTPPASPSAPRPVTRTPRTAAPPAR